MIAGRARSIQRKSKDPDAVEKNAGIVAEQTARITRIIQRLLDFTRRKVGTHHRADTSLDDMIATTLELLAGQIHGARVKTRHERGAGVPRIAVDSDRLQQVLINLFLNAVQAMPDGGSLTIETGIVTRTRPGLEGSAEQRFASIAVRDSGVGIPEDIRDKNLRSVLHDQGRPGRHRARARGVLRHRQGARWLDRCRQRRRRRHRVHGVPARLTRDAPAVTSSIICSLRDDGIGGMSPP